MKKLTFEWDQKKAISNLKKHGVSFEEAICIFQDSNAITIVDPNHSTNEDREITIGISNHLRLVVVCHTDQSGNMRIFSARKATKREINQYQGLT